MKTDWEKIEAECKAVVENKMMDTVLWYLQEHPDKRHEWVIAFESTFYEMVEQIDDDLWLAEFEEEKANRKEV